MELTDYVGNIITKLKQFKFALQEKIETVTSLDDEMLELVDDGNVENEIEQANTFKEQVQRTIIDSTSTLETRKIMGTNDDSDDWYSNGRYNSLWSYNTYNHSNRSY